MEQPQLGHWSFCWDQWFPVLKKGKWNTAANNQETASHLLLSFFFSSKKETENKKKIKKIPVEHKKKIFGPLCSPHLGMHEMAIINKKLR